MAYKKLAENQLCQRYRAHQYDDPFYRQEDVKAGRLYNYAYDWEAECFDADAESHYYCCGNPFSPQEYSDYICQRDFSMASQKIVNVASLKGICKADLFKPLWEKMSAANDGNITGIEYRLAAFVRKIRYERHDDTFYTDLQSSLGDMQSLEVVNAACGDNPALIKNICLFSSFWVRSPLSWDESSGVELFEHLFVIYEDYPAFLKKTWHSSNLADNLKWMAWFILYVQGGSLKAASKLCGWYPSSHKFWHYLRKETSQSVPVKVVAMAELKRLGMGENDCLLILDNPSYVIDITDPTYADNKPLLRFWYDAVYWLMGNSAALEGDMKARVLAWARHRYTDTEISPENKGFSLKGRSAVNVIDATNAYYNQIQASRRLSMRRGWQERIQNAIPRTRRRIGRALQDVLESDSETAPRQQWAPQGWGWGVRYTLNEIWVFTELTNAGDLSDEGYLMSHCVGMYADACRQGKSVIVSLQQNDVRCVTIHINPATKKMIEARGFANQDITSQQQRMIKAWMRDVVTAR